MKWRILVTGPLANLERFAQAAESAGWTPVVFPLLEVRPRLLAAEGEPKRPDWICVTSQNAVAALEAAFDRLRGVPCATVGTKSAERLRQLGFRVELEGCATAHELGEELAERLERGQSVLWPRGSVQDELAWQLRERGIEVEDPIAYETLEREDEAALPGAEAIFFASPSAVRAHARRATTDKPSPALAFAIGATTQAALAEAGGARFEYKVELSEPTPAAFAAALRLWKSV